MPDLVVHEEEVYDDEDDENDEANWRNDYPEDESDSEGDKEERYGGVYLRCGLWPAFFTPTQFFRSVLIYRPDQMSLF